MSIYATLWTLKFPKDGDEYLDCEWVGVRAQGVPAHIGSRRSGAGGGNDDPFAEFLPPPVNTDENGEAPFMRAVVFVVENSKKGTERSGQEYPDPLLVLTGEEYAAVSFEALHLRLCDALRGGRPRLVAEFLTPKGGHEVIREQ